MPALVAGFTSAIVFTAVLSIVVTVAGPDGLNLADDRTRGWIALAYGHPSVLSIPVLVRYRTPLLLTGNGVRVDRSPGDRILTARRPHLVAEGRGHGEFVMEHRHRRLRGRLVVDTRWQGKWLSP